MELSIAFLRCPERLHEGPGFPGVTRKLKKDELLLLKSKEVIAINQDPLGVAGDRVWKQGPYEACPIHLCTLVG